MKKMNLLIFININVVLFASGFGTYLLLNKLRSISPNYILYMTLAWTEYIYRILCISIFPALIFSLIFFIVLYLKKPIPKEIMEKRKQEKINRLEKKINKLKENN